MLQAVLAMLPGRLHEAACQGLSTQGCIFCFCSTLPMGLEGRKADADWSSICRITYTNQILFS